MRQALPFTIGKGNVLREGDDITLIANGIMVAEALEAAHQLEQEGVSAAVIDMFTLKPIDRMLVKNYAEKTRRIVTCENHSIHNGLGSAVAEVLVENCPVPMRRVGVKRALWAGRNAGFLTKRVRTHRRSDCRSREITALIMEILPDGADAHPAFWINDIPSSARQ
ncbi:transketolase C-terminal section [Salmonella enterica subsp. enterica]|uniref:Transketolase C-terminal section n=1 Tax=Salmonella enterica I TaxID=59201 RepID=A0A447N714_SALET|nr:transketolase C-terminal section [Salmonella enterica subsp. enterica]